MKLYKIFTFACLILLYQCKSTRGLQVENENQKMDLYLLIGQSNMAGRAPLELEDRDTLVNVFLFNENSKIPWERAANPFNKYSTIRKHMRMQKLGLGYGFAKRMNKMMPKQKIGLIVNAKGGTSIEEWKPGDSLYREAVERAKQAMSYGVLKGIVWHQGETNAARYDTYMPEIVNLIAAFRKDLNHANLPFVAGQLSADKPERIPFNNMILDLPKTVKNTRVVTTENTSTIDNTHFDNKSQKLLGERYATEMLKLISK